MTAPLVPADCDLRDFPFTPLFRSRLFGSSFHARATDAEWRAGVTLWLKSWDQVPAGSLPDDDIDLCRLAELGRDLKAWRKVKDGAMRGWIKCDDGRLYHPVVAEGVLEAWERRVRAIRKGKAGASARWSGTDASTMPGPSSPDSTGISTGNATAIAQAMPGDGNRQGQRREKETPSLRSGGKKATRIASDWRPSAEDLEYARSQGMPEGVIDREAEDFRDYWVAKPGKEGTKLDWPATWRTWIRRTCQRAGYKPLALQANGHAGPTPPKDEADAIRRLEVGRLHQRWPTPKWGAMPNRPGCLIPPHLIRPDDGKGWREWDEQ